MEPEPNRSVTSFEPNRNQAKAGAVPILKRIFFFGDLWAGPLLLRNNGHGAWAQGKALQGRGKNGNGSDLESELDYLGPVPILYMEEPGTAGSDTGTARSEAMV